MQVMIVDDDPADRLLFRLTLEEAIDGVAVVEANGANEVLAVLSETDLHIDAIFLDINMPEMTGIDLLSHISQNPTLRTRLKQAHIYILTGAQDATAPLGLLGIVPIQKPIGIPLLGELLTPLHNAARDADCGSMLLT